MTYLNTKRAAKVLGVKTCTLAHAVWDERIKAPKKGPGGAYIWTIEDIERAAWILHCYDRFTKWQQGAKQ